MSYRAPIYDTVYSGLLRRIDPERSHNLAARSLRVAGRVPGLPRLARRRLGRVDASLRVQALGLDFATPLGIAAGVDKNATWFRELGLLGFGAVEVGSVTALAQPGNEARPRVTRLHPDRALLNAMGFPNDGCEAIAARLAAARQRWAGELPVLGVNIGKSKVVEIEDAVADYRRSTRLLAPLADYLALNVSSPNTPGLRQMQSSQHLADLVGGVREELAELGLSRELPVLVKLAPDLSDADLREIAATALELKVDGIIATNTTIDTSVAARSQAEVADQSHGGGVSGAPLKERSLEVLRLLRRETGGRITLVSVGGIENDGDVWQRILAGATLVQAYTGFVYGGPSWPRRLHRELAAKVRAAGLRSIEDAIGADVTPTTPAA
jgi:dihydroorotate dehydrogenase